MISVGNSSVAISAHDTVIAKWFDALSADPIGQVRKLLASTADIGRYRAAEPRDAARVLFAGLDPASAPRFALEQGLSGWLEMLRKGNLEFSAPRKAYEAGEAFAIVGRLRLSQVISDVRAELDDWLEWAVEISRQNKFDALADLYAALALTQKSYADLASSKAFALEPLWLDLCRGAGSRYPSSYLSIGMLGLRSLPERVGAVNDQAWLRGLTIWAEEQEPSIHDFGHQWRAMCALYPRAKKHWKTHVSYALRDAYVPLAIADYWKHEIGLTPDVESAIQPDPARVLMSSANQLAALLDRLDRPLAQIEMHIRNDIHARENYAQVTGFSYYLTTTCCNVGMRLLEGGANHERVGRGRLAAELALKTLRWSPDDVFGWALWRDALEAQSLLDAAELVGWESIRRYPENPQWRTQLALLFVRSGRANDAEKLLLEARARFPTEPAIVSILAELMLAKGDLGRARSFADTGLAFGEPTVAAFSVSSRLALHTQGAQAALGVLERGMRYHAEDVGLSGYRTTIMEGKPLPLVTSSFKAVEVGSSNGQSNASLADIPRSTRRGGALRRIASQLERTAADHAQAVAQVRAILADAPNNEYARYLDSSLEEAPASEKTTFAERLRDLVFHGQTDGFDDLVTMSPERTRIVEMVRAVVMKDSEAASTVLSWLRYGPQREARSVAALRGFVTGRLSEIGVVSFDDLSADFLIDVLAANDNFRLDIVEASLAPGRLLLAA